MKTRFLVFPFILSLFFGMLFGCQEVVMQMGEEQRLYYSKCSSCHNIIATSEHDKETWEKYTDKYGKKLTREEKELILGYLTESN